MRCCTHPRVPFTLPSATPLLPCIHARSLFVYSATVMLVKKTVEVIVTVHNDSIFGQIFQLLKLSIELHNVYIGSYDHTVRLFDTRCSSSVLRIDHGSPVESVVMFPGGGIVASAGLLFDCSYVLLYSQLHLFSFYQ